MRGEVEDFMKILEDSMRASLKYINRVYLINIIFKNI